MDLLTWMVPIGPRLQKVEQEGNLGTWSSRHFSTTLWTTSYRSGDRLWPSQRPLAEFQRFLRLLWRCPITYRSIDRPFTEPVRSRYATGFQYSTVPAPTSAVEYDCCVKQSRCWYRRRICYPLPLLLLLLLPLLLLLLLLPLLLLLLLP